MLLSLLVFRLWLFFLLSLLHSSNTVFLLYNSVHWSVFIYFSGKCFSTVSEYLQMSRTWFVGKIWWSSLYLNVLISFIKCAKKILTAINVASILFASLVFYICIEMQKYILLKFVAVFAAKTKLNSNVSLCWTSVVRWECAVDLALSW